MNCSTISISRTAASAVTNGASPNGCASALNGSFINSTSNGTSSSSTTVASVAMSPILNGAATHNMANGKGHIVSNMHTMANHGTKSNVNINLAVANITTKSPTTTTATTTAQSKKPELAAKIIQQSDIVCFDVDSTVIKEEGIDELANFCGKGNEVARVTKEAMGGGMTFQDALKIRLNIIRPTQQQIADFIKTRPSTLTRNVKRFIEKLRADGKQVYLITGGFDCLIEPVARELGIPMTHVFANKLMFYYNGDYASFDTTQPTSKTGGKAEAISILKQRYEANRKANATATAIDDDAMITMIGDGATDLEAVPPANHFIGFGGNVVRDEVFKRAQYYITDFEQLM